MTEYLWREISCQKSVRGADFDRGVQDFNFQVGNPTAWIPSKSYFKVDMTLTGSGGNQPTTRQAVAFADNACSALYNNVYFRAGGQDVSSVVNYVPQIGAAKCRLQKSLGWQDSIGSSAMMIEADFDKRVRDVSATGGAEPESEGTIISVGDATHFADATVAIAVGGIVAGNFTEFTKAKVGDTLVVAGGRYSITGITSNTVLIVAGETVVVAATTDAYIIGQKDTGKHRNVVSAMWQPPIGIFDHTAPIGAGDFRISLNPTSNYKRSAVETINPTAVVGSAANNNNYDLVIDNVRFYVCTVKVSIPSGVSTLHLLEGMSQSKKAGLESTLEFTVPASTRAISVFIQNASAGSNPLYPPTMFKTGTAMERQLQSIQMTYANVSKPATRWSSDYNDNTNQLQQRYLETQLESGLISSQGGAETFEDFVKRGPMYHFSFQRDSEDKSTQVQLATSFRNAPSAITEDFNVFVVAWYSRSVQITTQSGTVVEVNALNV